jgi:hypothetical protein
MALASSGVGKDILTVSSEPPPLVDARSDSGDDGDGRTMKSIVVLLLPVVVFVFLVLVLVVVVLVVVVRGGDGGGWRRVLRCCTSTNVARGYDGVARPLFRATATIANGNMTKGDLMDVTVRGTLLSSASGR